MWCASSALNGIIFPVVAYVLQNTQRISSSTQPLATPVVSVTTPSLPPQGLVYSGMPTSYNPAGESGPDIKCLSCDCLHSALFSSLLFFWVILMLQQRCERALTVRGCICFYRVLPEQCRDLFPTGLQLSWALTGLHVGMATASAGPGSS